MDQQDIKQVVIQRRKMFDNAANVIYNLINDPLTNGAPTIHALLIAFNDNHRFIREAFRSGLAPILLGARLKEVQKFVDDEIPFIVVVKDGNAIFAIVSHEEIEF